MARELSEGMKMCLWGIWTKAEKPGEAGAVTIPETQKVRLVVDYNS